MLRPKLFNQVVITVNYFKLTFDIADVSGNPVAMGLNTGSGVTGAPTINISLKRLSKLDPLQMMAVDGL